MEKIEKCFLGKNPLKDITILRGLGSNDTRSSENYSAALTSDSTAVFALKFIPVEPTKRKGWIGIWDPCNAKMQIFLTRELGNFAREGKCQNFLMHYGHATDLTHTFTTKHLLDAPQNVMLSATELADGDLSEWMKRARGPLAWKSFIGQFLISMTVLQYYFGGVHNDLHWGNLLFNRSSSKAPAWKYHFFNEDEKTNIYIENTGEIWKLWDFDKTETIDDSKMSKIEMLKEISDFIKTYIFDGVTRQEIDSGKRSCTLSEASKKTLKSALATTYEYYSTRAETHKSPAFYLLLQLELLGWFRKTNKQHDTHVFKMYV